MMRTAANDIERLCRETGMPQDEAVRLLSRHGGDYRRARREWQDARSIFVEPLCVRDSARPTIDRIHQTFKQAFKKIRRFICGTSFLRLLGLIAAAASFTLLRRFGGWLLLGIMLLRCIPLIMQLLRPVFTSSKRSAPHIVL